MRPVCRNTLVALVSTASLVASAAAQCPDWREQPPMRGGGLIYAATSWDPDGAGPQSPWLVVAGDIDRAGVNDLATNNIAAWDGTNWHALGDGISNTVTFGIEALAVYNGELIAGGSFAFVGDDICFNIARWNGTSWRPLGDGIFGDVPGTDTVVSALTVYNGELIAGGRFAVAGQNTCRNIARWNGSQWRPLDSGITHFFHVMELVESLTVYNGELIAGGFFDRASGVTCANIARWNGSTWQDLPGGLGSTNNFHDRVRALTVYQNELIAGGAFFNNNCHAIARWDGTTWRTVGTDPLCGVPNNEAVSALATFNGSLYAAGGLHEIAGVPAHGVARWDGADWHALGESIDGIGEVLTVNNGELIVAGFCTRAGSHDAQSVARWNGDDWLPLDGVERDPFGRIEAIATWAGLVLIGGSHIASPPPGEFWGAQINLTAWNGTERVRFPFPDEPVHAMLTRAGPAHSTDLIIGGDFGQIEGTPANRIVRINDTLAGGWQPFGAGFNGSVRALEMHNGSLYAGGDFTMSGATPVNHIARWNGNTWEPLGAGPDGPVYAIKSFQGNLYVGGEFVSAHGVFAPGIAVWNGSFWASIHTTAFVGSVKALAIYDNVLVIGGDFPGVANSRNISWFGGEIFGTFGVGANAPVRALKVSNGTLVVGGDFTSAGGVNAGRLARWTGPVFPAGSGSWSSIGGGVDAPVYALATYGSEIQVGGEFKDVRNETLYSPLWARYSETGVPWLIANPASTQSECGGNVTFHVQAAQGYPGLAYQWRKDGVNLSSGPTGSGSTIVIDGPTLDLMNVNQSDAGAYDCVVSNACGGVTTFPATLSIDGDCSPCAADFNADGFVNSQDLFDFLRAFFDADRAADFNADGFINSQDLFDFLGAFFVGC